MYPRVVSCLIFFLSVFPIHRAAASIEVECDRPAPIAFDHSQSPDLEAVITSNELLKQYGIEAQAYVKCLQRVIVAERDEILAEIKKVRKKNIEFRKAYINK